MRPSGREAFSEDSGERWAAASAVSDWARKWPRFIAEETANGEDRAEDRERGREEDKKEGEGGRIWLFIFSFAVFVLRNKMRNLSLLYTINPY